jgi:hypothetical protein
LGFWDNPYKDLINLFSINNNVYANENINIINNENNTKTEDLPEFIKEAINYDDAEYEALYVYDIHKHIVLLRPHLEDLLLDQEILNKRNLKLYDIQAYLLKSKYRYLFRNI